MVTRQVHGQLFLLRPGPSTNRIVGYIVAYVAGKYGILVHALKVMSNHWHVVVTDPNGNLVEFQRECHSLIGRAVNCLHREYGSFWGPQQTNQVECGEPEDVVRKIAYAMANAVEARLVRYGHNWPGLRLHWPQKPRVFKRPTKFFSDDMPAELTLGLVRPPGFDELSDDELGDRVRVAITEREDKFRDEADSENKRFLGRKTILSQRRHDQPTKASPRFGISPRVAAQSRWRRIELIQRNRAWSAEYDLTLTRWRAGDRTVVFPYGTYQMRAIHNVNCADPPT